MTEVWMTIVESGWNLWVWLAGGSVASGWNLWVWLQCIGVLVGVVVRRYIDILTIILNFSYSSYIRSFWEQHPYFFVHFKNVFSVLYIIESIDSYK